MTKPLVLSPTAVTKYRLCRRLYAFEYNENLRPPPSPKQQFGIDVHKQLERWLKAGTEPDESPEGRTAWQGIEKGWLPKPDDRLLIEQRFEFPIREGLAVGGYIDCAAPPGVAGDDPLICDHKCVHHEDRLWTSSGRVVVEELCQRRRAVIATDSGVQTASFSDNGEQDIWHLKTISGRECRLTAEHPIWTDKGWVQVNQISPGDFVACSPPKIIGSVELRNEEIELLGYFLGDGSFGEKAIQFSSSNPNTLARVAWLLTQLSSSFGVSKSRSASNVRLHRNTPMWEFFHDRLHLRERAPNKYIPIIALNAPDEQLCLLLAGLWSTDGCVNHQVCRGNDVRICYSTRSEQLGRDVQQCLWRLGIWAGRRRFEVKYNGRLLSYWQVNVQGVKTKLDFLRRIGSLMSWRRSITLDQAILYLEMPRGKRRCRENKISSVSSLVTISKIPCSEKIHWDRVESCEQKGKASTVAVTVDGHVFLSEDGIVTHNTSSDLRWAKTEEQLLIDPQVLIYGIWAMLKWQSPTVRARWVYYAATNPKDDQPRQPRGAKPVEVLLSNQSADVMASIEQVLADMEVMASIRAGNQLGLTFPPNPASCGIFGGCPHMERCNLSPSDRLAAYMESGY